jgi:hypothetical protein
MKKIILSMMLLSAIATPAFANYFSNPALGVNRNIGSAPNPTPQQVRDSHQPTVANAPAKSPQPSTRG